MVCLACVEEEFSVTHFLDLFESPDLNSWQKPSVFTAVINNSKVGGASQHVSVLAVIKTHLMCLQDMFFVFVDVPNLSDKNRNLPVPIESKESSKLKLKQLSLMLSGNRLIKKRRS